MSDGNVSEGISHFSLLPLNFNALNFNKILASFSSVAGPNKYRQAKEPELKAKILKLKSFFPNLSYKNSISCIINNCIIF